MALFAFSHGYCSTVCMMGAPAAAGSSSSDEPERQRAATIMTALTNVGIVAGALLAFLWLLVPSIQAMVAMSCREGLPSASESVAVLAQRSGAAWWHGWYTYFKLKLNIFAPGFSVHTTSTQLRDLQQHRAVTHVALHPRPPAHPRAPPRSRVLCQRQSSLRSCGLACEPQSRDEMPCVAGVINIAAHTESIV